MFDFWKSIMLKKCPSGNQRTKGLKVKHAVQICLLIVIGVWLLYKVEHSHAKKEGYEESSVEISEKMQSKYGILKFGRKHLQPKVEEMEKAMDNKRHGEKEEEEEPGEKDEEVKPEAREDEEGLGRDDEIDGHDQDDAEEEEIEKLEDFLDEDLKDREDENEEQDTEEDDDIEDTVSSEDGAERTAREEQEDHHKGNDASTAMVQKLKAMTTETENRED
ncbi:uncharacterized protein LOC131161285 [Malania oleifera]|uniref:uncharacterized protein LOC131161285 n=1 Tax=Malania oleifera TaxID=397392 RepID=UPI0025ADD1EB|nr:uncharacterized protein LOC131161285 [Malania oleifera]XP_057972917.1 uncharacterized protein LOC131161285 [Malania oleifera]